MKKVAVIGHLDWQGNNMIGAVVKARSIYEELQNQLGKGLVGCVDIHNWKKNVFTVALRIVFAFSRYKNIVLVCSDTSTTLMSLFSKLKRIFHNKILYCVVGGDMAELLEDNPNQLRGLSYIDNFFVETVDCLEGLQKLGIQKVSLMRNFKCIKAVGEEELKKKYNEPYHFCTFSRVTEQKGITDAILAIHNINSESGHRICELDIYGSIDPAYKDSFEDFLKSNEDARYCGVVDANSSVDIFP